MRQIPEESLEKCSLQQFVEEYEGFRAWLQSLKSTPFVREFYKIVRCRLQVASGTSATGRASFWVSPAGIREVTDDNFIPKSGAFVHSRKHGRCQVMEVETRICNTRLYRYVMTTPYMEIHCRKIWHVVRAYHRCTLLAVPSESLAESVGSVLADAAGKGTKPMDVESFIRQATIRLAGLRGHGGEEGVLSDALNFHYEGRDPSCWRFVCRSASGD